MKQFNLVISVFLINILCVNAQDYQTVRSGRIAYFNSDQSRIKCIRIDSVSFDKDSVLYPMHNIQQTAYNCFTPRGNSWIGKKVIIQANGVNLFFNNNNDTIRINTRAKVNESWTIFEIKDSIKVIAEVKSAEIQAILGETDSVKTIGFKVYDKNGLVDHQYLSEKTLIISKSYGFVRMMNFSLFPKVPNSSSFEILESLDLIGLTNPDRGVQNLTLMDVFDFQEGDELHVFYESSDWIPGMGYLTTLKTKFKYLERIKSKDFVTYKIDREESTFRRIQKWDSTTYEYVHDTMKVVYRPDSLFDKLPGEPIISENGAYANRMENIFPVSKTVPFDHIIDRGLDNNCWGMIIYDGCYHDNTYLKGLGGPFYWCQNAFSLGGEENKLVYYKKGSTTWGTPLVITAVDRLKTGDEILVYPNPASDFVTIENISGKTEKYMVSLADMQGREVFRKETTVSNSYRLDVSSLKTGVYLLKLQKGKAIISKMMIKKQK